MTTPTPRTDAKLVRSPYIGKNVSADFARQLERELAAAQEWREAVLNELIVAHIYTKEHDTNPRKAIQDAITWNCQVALDPAVSSDARKLVAQERERCAYICDRWSGVGDVVARAIAAAIRRGDTLSRHQPCAFKSAS